MEKIKDALAKAKQENTYSKPTVKVNLASDDVNKLNNVLDGHNEFTEIEYQNTQVVKLDSSHLEKNRILSHLKKDIHSGVFDSLRTQVLQKMEDNNWRTIAVVSPTPESGKTLVSINLSISISNQPNRTAILVDFDLRRPKVATYLGIHTEKSVTDYLAGEAQLQEVMFNPGIPGLVVMPTMRAISKSAEMLASRKVKGLVEDLRTKYESRIVIFDLPPVLNTDDALVILPHIDCILLVVANGMSTQAEIEETLHHLPREKLLGVVLNKAEVESKAYYY
jgi:protein-tyrosine kinase